MPGMHHPYFGELKFSVGDEVIWARRVGHQKPQLAQLIRVEISHFTPKTIVVKIKDPVGKVAYRRALPEELRAI